MFKSVIISFVFLFFINCSNVHSNGEIICRGGDARYGVEGNVELWYYGHGESPARSVLKSCPSIFMVIDFSDLPTEERDNFREQVLIERHLRNRGSAEFSISARAIVIAPNQEFSVPRIRLKRILSIQREALPPDVKYFLAS